MGESKPSPKPLSRKGRGKIASPFTIHTSLKKRAAFTIAEGVTHAAHFGTVRKAAFTLAEVLITLGIIGVVAAMTMPSLIQSHQDKEITARLKKVYSVLGNAYLRAYTDIGEPTTWGLITIGTSGSLEDYKSSVALYEAMGKYINIARDCKNTTNSGCFASGNYYYLDGSKWTNYETARHIYRVITNDGVSLGFHGYSADCSAQELNMTKCGVIHVDIDGPKRGTSTFGKDLFRFFVTEKGIVPDGVPLQVGSNDFNDTQCSKLGYHCTIWVLENGNRDYLRCNGLNYNGKTKCK